MTKEKPITGGEPSLNSDATWVAEHIIKMGRIEWGQTDEKSDADHVRDFENSLAITRQYFKTEGAQALNGVYLEGTETVLGHTGISPNSARNAQIIVAVWNKLHDEIASGKAPSAVHKDASDCQTVHNTGLEALKLEVTDNLVGGSSKDYSAHSTSKLLCLKIEGALDYLASRGHLKTTGEDEKGVDLDAIKRDAHIYACTKVSHAQPRQMYLDCAIDYLASTGRIRGEWRPISEAPRDGTEILAYLPYGGGFITQTYMRHDRSHSYWWCESGELCPTHFMPLPAAPGEMG